MPHRFSLRFDQHAGRALAAFLEVLNGYTLADVLARQPDFSRFLHQTAKS